MKRLLFTMILLAAFGSASVYAEDQSLTKYLSSFDYAARKDMKIDSKELAQLLIEDRAQLIDIRFKEEYEAWHMGVAKSIPLPELSKRHNEIDKTKIVVVACPHKDRAIIAMTFLRTQGYKAKYLKDGLLGFAEYLRGDKARDFVDSLPRERE